MPTDHHTPIAASAAANSATINAPLSELDAAISAVPRLEFAILRDQKTAGTNGGTFTQDAWQTRTLNTEHLDTGGIVSLSANQFTLQAGKYLIRASAPAFGVTNHQLRLQNMTDTTTDLVGQTGESDTDVQTTAHLVGYLDISAQKTFELQHYCLTTKAGDGFGQAMGITTELYATVEITQLIGY